MGKIKMYLFKKTFVVKEGEHKGAKIDNYFMKFTNGNVSISTNLTNDVKAKLLKSGCDFPYIIELEYDKENSNGNRDYFMTNESFKNEAGEDQLKDVCVIQDYRSVEHYNITGSDLEDYFVEHSKE